jgi:hypothetical protein
VAVSEPDEVERVLGGFWAEVLEVESVAPGDHLLDLGGNSLVATMVANRIELTWGFRPSMEDMLSRSLRELAGICGEGIGGGGGVSAG